MRVKEQAKKTGKLEVIQAINVAYSAKIRKEGKSQARPHSILRSNQVDVDIRANVDTDKNYFLNEFLKLLAYAEQYLRSK